MIFNTVCPWNFVGQKPILKPNVKAKGASLVAQVVKKLPAVQETPVRSLGWEDLLEKGMATHSSILAWKIPWTEEPRGFSPHKKS